LIVSGKFFPLAGTLPPSEAEAFSFRLEELIARLAPSTRQDLPILLLHDLDDLPTESSTHYKHVDFHAIFLIERGRGIHMIDSAPYAISRGDVYVLGPGSEGHFLDCERLVVHVVMFTPALFKRSTWNGLAALPGLESLLIGATSRRLHLPPTVYAEAARDLAQLWSEWRSGTRSGAMMVPALLVALLVRLSRFATGDPPPALHPPARRPDRNTIVAAAVRTIDLRYGETLRVAELAAEAHLSPDHFTEIFSAVMGQTPRDYIRHVRLEHAKTLLTTTTLPISEIARTTGLRTHPNFTRAFRAAIGTSPKEFRRQSCFQGLAGELGVTGSSPVPPTFRGIARTVARIL